MKHLVMPAELWVLVAKRVEAVRATRDDGLYVVLIQRGDVPLGQLLEQELVADPPGRIAGTFFFAAQNGELHAGLRQQLGGCAHDFLVSLDQRPAAADPQQHVGVFRVFDRRHVKVPDPIDARERRPPHRMTARLERRERLLHRVGKLGVLHHQVSPCIDDLGHLLDRYRTSLDARGAGRTLPHRLGRQRRRRADERLRIVARRIACQPLQVENDVARREPLAHPTGRARRRAAAALGAGVEIQQVLPGETGQGVNAQGFFAFEVDSPQRGADRRQPRGVNIRGRAEHVNHLGVRRPGEKSEHQRQVRPPSGPVRRRHRLDRHQRPRGDRHQIAERRPCAPRIIRGGDPPSFHQKARDENRQDKDQDPRRFGRVHQIRGPRDPSPRRSHQDANDRQRAEDIHRQRLKDQIELALHDRDAEVVIDQHHHRGDE